MYVCWLAHPFAGAVAQSVERWAPCGGSTRPGLMSTFEARRVIDAYESMSMIVVGGRP